MTQYIIRRLLLIIPTVLLVTMVLFALLRLTPGDPVRDQFGLDLTPEIYKTRKHQLGLDQPLPVQYVKWLNGLAHLDFGKSVRTPRPVKQVVFERFPATLELALISFFVGLVISVSLGTLAAVYNKSLVSPTVTVFGLAAVSTPTFFLSTLLVYYITFKWKLLPFPSYIAFTQNPMKNLQLVILPALALTIPAVGAPTRIIRSNVMEALTEDYIRTARAKGLSDAVVVIRHGLRNALLPSVTLIGLTVATLWEGAFITEFIFNWPGVGRLAITSLRSKDYTVVQAIVLMAALSYSFANLVVDILYAKLDPRISYVGKR
jgi:peptide/nickel transport system permease protein